MDNTLTMRQAGMFPEGGAMFDIPEDDTNPEASEGIIEKGRAFLTERLSGFKESLDTNCQRWSESMGTFLSETYGKAKLGAMVVAQEAIFHPAFMRLTQDPPDAPGDFAVAAAIIALPYVINLAKAIYAKELQ